jgi:hypothetical protein
VEVEGMEWMDIDGDGVMAMGPVTALNGDGHGDGHVYIHTYIHTCIHGPGVLV